MQVTEDIQVIAAVGDAAAQAPWHKTRAKILARQGQFPAARQLTGQVIALASATLHIAPGRDAGR